MIFNVNLFLIIAIVNIVYGVFHLIFMKKEGVMVSVFHTLGLLKSKMKNNSFSSTTTKRIGYVLFFLHIICICSFVIFICSFIFNLVSKY